ncbi:hypothetical protein VKT23_012019 [Stygiomarasmius scandens]|uniref:Uncharacterized protein n=1 Tax=Marasmiellus scandens TaxID=2682957 RepID=A0ABR1J832_9AGAR
MRYFIPLGFIILIRAESIIRNSSHNKSTGEKRGSVDVSDLAEVAAEILLKEEVVHPSAEYVVMGSELLAYPQVVSLLSGNLCRPIVFERRSASQVQLRLPSGQFKICNPVTGLRVLDNLDDDNVPWD